MNATTITQVVCSPDELGQIIAKHLHAMIDAELPRQELFTSREAADFLRMKSERAFRELGLPCTMPNGKTKLWTRAVLLRHIADCSVVGSMQAKSYVGALHYAKEAV